jgi:hypothetical protein
MDFLDGFLIRKERLKGKSVQELFEEKLNSDEFNTSSEFSTKEIIDLVDKAKATTKSPIFNKIYARTLEDSNIKNERGFLTNPKMSTDAHNTIGSEDSSNIDDIIVSALREIQREFLLNEPKDETEKLFFHLITQFDKPKKRRNAPTRIKGKTQNIIVRVLQNLIAGHDISDELQNIMHDEGLISLNFLLQLQDIKEGTTTLNPDVNRKFERNPELLDKLIALIEELSGYSSPKRNDLIAELKRLQSKQSAAEEIRVGTILSDTYKYSRSSIKQMSKLRRKLNRLVDNWDNVKNKFYSNTDIVSEGGEEIIEEVWGTKALQQNLVDEWRDVANMHGIEIEEHLSVNIKEEIERLLKAWLQIEEILTAGAKLERLINEKNPHELTFLDKELETRVEKIETELQLIQDGTENYEAFKEEILREIKGDLNKMLNVQLIKAYSPMLDKASPKKQKKIKKVLQSSQPSEYMGQDFTKLGSLLSELQDLDTNKSDKKMRKKFESFEERNLNLVSRASELRKDYELLYRQLRGMVYPKSQGDLGEEKDE